MFVKVCMVVYSFYESDNRVMRYAETLARRGDDVDIIALKKEGTSNYELLRGVTVYRVQKREKDEKSKLSYIYRLMKFFIISSLLLARLHFKKHYKVIHVHNMPDFLVFVAFFPKLFGAKVLLDIHDVVPELYMTKFKGGKNSQLFKLLLLIEKASCKFADHVIIANHLWHRLIISRSARNDKCSVVMNFPDENIFFRRPRTRSDDKLIMIYPGSLNLRQGLDVAIKAFFIIKDKIPKAEFHIYGDGGDINLLEDLVEKLNLQQRVFFKGSLPIYEVAGAMANADIGIEPKKNDPFAGSAMSTKILEFMALGIPVIVSDTDVHKYYFNDDVVLFFKSNDEQDLARCMLLLINDRDLRQRLLSNISIFVEDYIWDKRKEEYLGLIDKLLQNNQTS